MKKTATALKIIFLIIASSIVLGTKNTIVLSAVLFSVFFSTFFIGEKKKIIERLQFLIPTGLLILLFQVLFNTGTGLPLKLTFFYTVFSKIIIISYLVMLFTTTSSVSEIISLFSFLPEDYRLMLTMTFYFIPLIFEEAKFIAIVRKSRGSNAWKWDLSPLLIPVLHRIFKRAEALAISIVSRGY